MASAGSALAGRLLANQSYRVERYMQAVFTVAAAALFVPVLFHTSNVSEMLAGDAAPGAPSPFQRPGKPRMVNGRRGCVQYGRKGTRRL